MTITSHPRAGVYAKQIGAKIESGEQLSTEGTVSELRVRIKDATGNLPPKRLLKGDLVAMITKRNKANLITVDTDRLTARQRRRLRKKYGVAGA